MAKAKYPWQTVAPGEWFLFDADTKLTSARSSASTNSLGSGRKFRVFMAENDRICCQRVDGLAMDAPSTQDIPVGNLDTVPAVASSRASHYRYPWSIMDPGHWFYFSPGTSLDTARVSAAKKQGDCRTQFRVLRARNGRLFCVRIDHLKADELPRQSEAPEYAPGGGYDRLPGFIETYPEIDPIKPDYASKFSDDEMSQQDRFFWQIRKAEASTESETDDFKFQMAAALSSNSPEQKRRDELYNDENDRDYPEFMKWLRISSSWSRPDAKKWCIKNMPPEKLHQTGGIMVGCPLEENHPYWKV